jgi:hypothetical protein
MCRYGFKNYKLTYACFKCKVGFKRPHLSDVQPQIADAMQKIAKQNGTAMQAKDAKCPNCGNQTANLGRDLRLPAKTKHEQWRCIQYLYEKQYNIYSCGCSGIGFIPHKIEDAIVLVKEYENRVALYAKQTTLHEKEIGLEKKRKKNNDALKEKKIFKQIKLELTQAKK